MAWSQSKELNDLHMLPGLVCEGNWTNDPTLPRELLINLIKELGTSNWWSMSSLLNQLKTKAPDFQRPAGDYDSWFIREEKTHLALRGFAKGFGIFFFKSLRGLALDSANLGDFLAGFPLFQFLVLGSSFWDPFFTFPAPEDGLQ